MNSKNPATITHEMIRNETDPEKKRALLQQYTDNLAAETPTPKELPSAEQIAMQALATEGEYRNSEWKRGYRTGFVNCGDWIIQKVKSLLSSKDSELAKKEEENRTLREELENLNQERDELRQGHQALLHYQQKLISELQSLKQSQAKPGETVYRKVSVKENGYPQKHGKYIFLNISGDALSVKINPVEKSREYWPVNGIDKPLVEYFEPTTLPRVEEGLDGLPENLPLYKDSGLWQLRSDDMETVLFQQRADESTSDFLLRIKANTNPQNDKG